MTAPRILVAGGPRVGKTWVADRIGAELGIPVRHTDDLIGTHGWSEASEEVARWMDEPGPWVIEGVAVVRALRKWLRAHPAGRPADLVYRGWSRRIPTTLKQDAMGDGARTVWEEIVAELWGRMGRDAYLRVLPMSDLAPQMLWGVFITPLLRQHVAQVTP